MGTALDRSMPNSYEATLLSTRDQLISGLYTSWEGLKIGVRATVYNEQNLDLPQLQLVEKTGKWGSDHHLEIKSEGRERDYMLHLPPSYDGSKPMPLVVVLHGFGQDGAKISNLSKMSETADREGFIVAYPNATKWFGTQRLQAWDIDNGVAPPGTESNDVGFIKDLVSTLRSNLKIDDSRVFAAGYSNGGMLAYKLAGEMSETFSAIAVVSSGSSGREAIPANPVSVLSIHGTNDAVVPLGGLSEGYTIESLGVPHVQSQRESFETWSKRAGIKEPPTFDQNASLMKARSVNRDTGAEIVTYIVRRGGHEWPGSDRAIKRDSKSPEAKFPASQKIWDFFKSHPKTKRPSPPSPTLPS
ncbi:MAG: dienelactone hydrolase family protein [Candidatus Obscuribacterales bacterium]|nr:dienelactone hydrolase family protein [Candidatus Obscuribacterales bacterium]